MYFLTGKKNRQWIIAKELIIKLESLKEWDFGTGSLRARKDWQKWRALKKIIIEKSIGILQSPQIQNELIYD